MSSIALDGYTTLDVREAHNIVSFFRVNPLYYMKEVLGMKYLPPTLCDVVNHIATNKWTLVRSGHGIGKSYVFGAVVPWYLETHPNSLVYTTAPTNRQVSEILWKEIFKHRQNALYPVGGKLLSNRLKLDKDWQAYGFASNQAVAYQGLHAKHMLWLIDEADGMPRDVLEAIMSTATGSQNKIAAIGNPVDPDSYFRELQDKLPDSTFSIPSFESPNIIYNTKVGKYEGDEIVPGCATLDWIYEIRDEFGEESDVYKSRVQAIYPSGTPNSLLTESEVKEVYDLGDKKDADWVIFGVDVAYMGDDKNCIVPLSGQRFLPDVFLKGKLKGWQLKNEVVKLEKHMALKGKRLMAIVYDAAGVATAFRESIENHYAGSEIFLMPIDFAGKVTEHRVEIQENNMHLVLNKRAEMFLDFRRAVIKKEVSLPSIYNLHKTVPKIKYIINNRSKLQIESKQEIKKRLKRSPDIEDGYVLAYHGKTLGLQYGRGYTKLVG